MDTQGKLNQGGCVLKSAREKKVDHKNKNYGDVLGEAP